jgi:hypothetical protein
VFCSALRYTSLCVLLSAVGRIVQGKDKNKGEKDGVGGKDRGRD